MLSATADRVAAFCKPQKVSNASIIWLAAEMAEAKGQLVRMAA